MKRILTLTTLALVAMIVVTGCKKETKPEKPKGFKTYNDELVKFTIKYPEGWAQAVSPGKIGAFYSDKDIADAFDKYAPGELRGAMIEVRVVKGGDAEAQASIDKLKADFTDPNVIKGPEKAMLNGQDAQKITVTFPVEDTKYTAERYYIIKDNAVTYIQTAVFGEYKDYKMIFDSAYAAFIPGAYMAATTTPVKGGKDSVTDVNEPPSETQKTYNGLGGVSISYPSNFSPTSGKNDVTLSGARNDCIIRIDVNDSKGMGLDKIAAENAKVYKSAPIKTKVAGRDAYLFNYGGGANLASRAYFVLGGTKLYRITTTVYKPQAASYQAAYDKAIASLKIP